MRDIYTLKEVFILGFLDKMYHEAFLLVFSIIIFPLWN